MMIWFRHRTLLFEQLLSRVIAPIVTYFSHLKKSMLSKISRRQIDLGSNQWIEILKEIIQKYNCVKVNKLGYNNQTNLKILNFTYKIWLMKMNIWILLQKYRIEVLELDLMAVSIKDSTSTEWNMEMELSSWLINFWLLCAITQFKHMVHEKCWI